MVGSRTAVNVIIAASNDVKRLSQRGCIRTRRATIRGLGRVKGPCIVILGSIHPCDDRALTLGRDLRRRCRTMIIPIGYRRVRQRSLIAIVGTVLFRFPIAHISFTVPG